jgi:hypothetical protein
MKNIKIFLSPAKFIENKKRSAHVPITDIKKDLLTPKMAESHVRDAIDKVVYGYLHFVQDIIEGAEE